MAGDLVLITGTTGHIGFHVLVHALDAGYSVRAAVRSQEKVESLLATSALQARKPGPRLSFVFVPDMTRPGAYDDAVQGVRYIIHVASPLPTLDMLPAQCESLLVRPAVLGTLGMLAAASKTSTVRRVVITSSIMAILPPALAPDQLEDTVFTAESRGPTPDPSTIEDSLQGYVAAKIKALNETEVWVAREKPAFDVINIMPSFCLGRQEMATPDLLLTHSFNLLALLIAAGSTIPWRLPASTVHVDDVARIHVAALDPKIPGNTSYLLIVAKHFPDAVASGILPNNGTITCAPVKLDATKTEQTFAFTHAPFEDQVKDAVAQYLELLANPGHASTF